MLVLHVSLHGTGIYRSVGVVPGGSMGKHIWQSHYSGFRVDSTGTRRCPLDGDPSNPNLGSLVPSSL